MMPHQVIFVHPKIRVIGKPTLFQLFQRGRVLFFKVAKLALRQEQPLAWRGQSNGSAVADDRVFFRFVEAPKMFFLFASSLNSSCTHLSTAKLYTVSDLMQPDP